MPAAASIDISLVLNTLALPVRTLVAVTNSLIFWHCRSCPISSTSSSTTRSGFRFSGLKV